VNFQLAKYFHDFKSNPEQAIVYYSKADALTGNRYLEAKESMARIHLEKGEKEKAKSLAAEVLQFQPNRPSAIDLISQASR
jgi:tetratricopeptide (TPR) repeat protein